MTMRQVTDIMADGKQDVMWMKKQIKYAYVQRHMYNTKNNLAGN